jgi:hypothetical protein
MGGEQDQSLGEVHGKLIDSRRFNKVVRIDGYSFSRATYPDLHFIPQHPFPLPISPDKKIHHKSFDIKI